MTGDRDLDRARTNILRHRELMSEYRATCEQIEQWEERKADRAVRRAALLERLRRIGRYFDPLGDHR
jgi:hypothetical protein